MLQEEALEEESKREGELIQWIESNRRKIEQFFQGREPEMEELIENIDKIEDMEIGVVALEMDE